MTSLYELASRRLEDAAFDVTAVPGEEHRAFLFENNTILGFAILYSNAADVIARWSRTQIV